jgi:hypothetical protein
MPLLLVSPYLPQLGWCDGTFPTSCYEPDVGLTGLFGWGRGTFSSAEDLDGSIQKGRRLSLMVFLDVANLVTDPF